MIDDPRGADVILVLAGETDRRPARALELLTRGYSPKVLLDVSASARVYNSSLLQLAQNYVQSLPNSQCVFICPITGLSTKTEAQDATRCVQQSGARRVLLVTSDYHTRRALSTFRHELKGYQISVAAAYDPQQFGTSWWRRRQWAKLNFDEWIRLAWWETVDRWR